MIHLKYLVNNLRIFLPLVSILLYACTNEKSIEGFDVNIRVNAIAPGKADTALRELIKEDKSKMLTANDHIPICIFLASVVI